MTDVLYVSVSFFLYQGNCQGVLGNDDCLNVSIVENDTLITLKYGLCNTARDKLHFNHSLVNRLVVNWV